MWLPVLLTLLIYNGMDNKRIILITETEIVTVPNKVRMTIGEIADLFGIY